MQRVKLKISLNGPILVFDAKYLVYRSKYSSGMSELSYKDIKTGLTFGFFSSVLSLVKRFKASELVFMFDVGTVGNSRRREQFPGYKKRKANQYKDYTAHEIKMEEHFEDSYKRIMELCFNLGFNCHKLSRFEADDLIAFFCIQYPHNEIINITRDEDIFQCLTKNVSQYSPDNKLRKTDKWFIKEYGINPDQWHLVKALAGCSSDTVPGVAGIGESRAISYILGSATDAINDKIKKASEDIDLYKKLVTLPHADAVCPKSLFKRSNLDMDKFISFCQKNGFRKFLEDLYHWEKFSQ